MKITQPEREQYQLECRARHFASQWLGVSLLLRLMNSLNVRRERFVFSTTLSQSLFDKDFLIAGC